MNLIKLKIQLIGIGGIRNRYMSLHMHIAYIVIAELKINPKINMFFYLCK